MPDFQSYTRYPGPGFPLAYTRNFPVILLPARSMNDGRLSNWPWSEESQTPTSSLSAMDFPKASSAVIVRSASSKFDPASAPICSAGLEESKRSVRAPPITRIAVCAELPPVEAVIFSAP
ncbi:MAG: hypothetical protein BWY76_01865 [bacterium ADurb.Bin429]|nr:MAG: hypothetical protein BWY76_01865 [bacterium ADurb.Bin429]